MNLRDNPDGTCNCKPLGGGCFFTDGFGGRCDCKCHFITKVPIALSDISKVCPRVPNFLVTQFGSIPISEVPTSTLQAIGEEWTKQLLKKATKSNVESSPSQPD